MKNDWYKFIGMLVIALINLGGVATAIPWATKSDVEEIKLHIVSIEALKHQDNIWYRELDSEFSERMARMEANQANIIEDIREIKQLITRGR